MSRTLASRSVRPTLEALETRNLLSAGTLGVLFNQSIGQLATQMSDALTALRSDATNLLRDLSGATAWGRAPLNITLQDYTRTGYDYGQIQGFSQGISAVGQADLMFIALAGGDSLTDPTVLVSLVGVSKAVKSANMDLSEATSIVNKNPSNAALQDGLLSVLALLPPA